MVIVVRMMEGVKQESSESHPRPSDAACGDLDAEKCIAKNNSCLRFLYKHIKPFSISEND